MRRRGGLGILIALEAIALAVILIVGVLTGGLSKLRGANVGQVTDTISSEERMQQANEAVSSALVNSSENSSVEAPEPSTASTEPSNTGSDTAFSVNASAAAQEKLSSMSLEQKVAQLFFVSPEALTHMGTVTAAGDSTKSAYQKYPVGGLVYSGKNFEDEAQSKKMLENTKTIAGDTVGAPLFLAVAELGGKDNSPVAKALEYKIADSPEELAKANDGAKAKAAAVSIAKYLQNLGINMCLGPVSSTADAVSEAKAAMTYGSDSSVAASMAAEAISGMHSGNIMTVSGYISDTQLGDTHEVLYQSAADQKTNAMMISGDNKDSAKVVDYLRNNLKFEGMIFSQAGLSADDSVMALKSGVSMIYRPERFEESYQAVLSAVSGGTIPEETIDAAVLVVLNQKM